MHMTAVFLLPLIALAAVRDLQGRARRPRRGLAAGVLFGLQFWLSTELLLTAPLGLGVGLVLAYLLLSRDEVSAPRALAPARSGGRDRGCRRRTARCTRPTGFQSSSINEPAHFDGDLLNFLLPTRLV